MHPPCARRVRSRLGERGERQLQRDCHAFLERRGGAYRKALARATVASLASSLAASLVGLALARTFSGRGQVPDALASDLRFLVAVAPALSVLVATRLGMPVSTTHVSVGAIFGVGLVNGRARWRTVVRIGLSRVTILPLAAATAAALYATLARLG